MRNILKEIELGHILLILIVLSAIYFFSLLTIGCFWVHWVWGVLACFTDSLILITALIIIRDEYWDDFIEWYNKKKVDRFINKNEREIKNNNKEQ